MPKTQMLYYALYFVLVLQHLHALILTFLTEILFVVASKSSFYIKRIDGKYFGFNLKATLQLIYY